MDADSYTCKNCGTQNSGKFCTECGEKKSQIPTFHLPLLSAKHLEPLQIWIQSF